VVVGRQEDSRNIGRDSHLTSNYVFVSLLAALWLAAFVFPFKKKPRRNTLRLIALIRMTSVWWVLGMSHRFLSFLVPDAILPHALDVILSYTIALPCRLGEGAEHVRAASLGTRFDLALAMVWGLPFTLVGSSLILALQTFVKKWLADRRRAQSHHTTTANTVGR